MPIGYQISSELDLVYIRWTGVVGLSEYQASFSQYLNDPRYRPSLSEFADMSHVAGLDFDFGEIQAVVGQLNRHLTKIQSSARKVIWAPHDDAFGTSRMFQELSDYMNGGSMNGGVQVEVRRDEREALAAIGVSDHTVAAMLRGYEFSRLKSSNDQEHDPLSCIEPNV